MDAHHLLLQRCFQAAAASSRVALERCVEEALASLQTAEESTHKLTERDSLTLARVGLLKLRGSWGAQYAAELMATFGTTAPVAAEPVNPVTASRFAALGAAASGFAALSLVDDAQITQDIEFARLSQQLRLQVEPVIADLDALVCAAQGLDRVQPELNGLRPEVFADVLRGLLNAANVQPDIRALWLKALAVPMGRELRGIYDKLIALLLGANVEAVSYRRIPSPSGAGGHAASGRPAESGPTGEYGSGGGGSGAGSSPGGTGGSSGNGGGGGQASEAAIDPLEGASVAYSVDSSQSGVSESLFREFLVAGVDHQARLADSYYARIEQEIQALRAEPESTSDSRQADLSAGTPPLTDGAQARRHVDGQSLLSQREWGGYAGARERKLVRAELRKEATHVGQVLGLEVVRQLVNEVAQDPRLLVPVRESIVALEPSLARLAMVDPRFFSDETHPGRRLMERVAQRSFKYNDVESTAFREFFDSVRRSFNALNSLKIESAQAFNSALGTLEAAWTESDRAEEANSHEVLHSLRFAEERQSLADQIAYDLSSRPDLDTVPGPVLDFLYGPWSLVMAHARLVDKANQIDPRGLGLVVSDLVWSVKRDFTLRQPAKLMDMIPGMVRKLSAGLDLIGQGPNERKAFFDILIRLHGPVLRLRRLKSEQDSGESGAVPLEADLLPATAEQRVPKAAAQPWLAPREHDEAGFDDTLPSGPSELETQVGDVDAAIDPAVPGEVRPEPGHEATAAGSPAPEPNAEHLERILMGFSTGCWVDLFSRQRWRRAQLVWASTKGTLFMFVSHGGRPHSMTRRSCERLIIHDLLRPVETHGVVARALSTLTNELQATKPMDLKQSAPAAPGSRFAQLH